MFTLSTEIRRQALVHHSKFRLHLIAALLQEDDNVRFRRFWVHPINQHRKCCGEFKRFYELYRSHNDRFFEYLRFSVAQFDDLLEKVKPRLAKNSFREPISAQKSIIIYFP